MADGVGWQVEGMTELVNDIQRMAQELSDAEGGNFRKTATEALTEAAQPVLEKAKAFVPVKTGMLKRTLRTGKVVKRPEKAGGGYRIDIGKFKGENGDEDGFYASFVEFGHGGPHGPAAPHPFLQPAFDAKREEANQIIKSKLSEALDRALGK